MKKIFKPRRQGRYEKLIKSGFLPFEAYTLSKVPLKVPYMKQMISWRKQLVKGMNKKESKEIINEVYGDRNWTKVEDNEINSPWAMLREFEAFYRRLLPDYETP